MPKRMIEPPVDKIDGCGRTCLFTVVVMWIAAILLGIYGLASVSNMLSK